jgi:hypothetical protein
VALNQGGRRGRIVPDFLIAAHAQLHADRLLAHNRGFYRDYFAKLNLWDPSASKIEEALIDCRQRLRWESGMYDFSMRVVLTPV